jgi:hypothetical protein
MQYSEILSGIERLTKTQSATTSSYPLAAKTIDVNFAYAKYFSIAQEFSKSFLADDQNQTDYPIIPIDLVANQKDYPLTVDGSSIPNQIQNIYRVELTDENGLDHLLKPIDMEEIDCALAEYKKTAGVPQEYDKTSSSIFLYPTPSYSLVSGLKLYFSRTPIYFTVSDTTKEPGIPHQFHYFLVLYPAYLYCVANALPQANAYKNELLEMIDNIKDYANRSRDTRNRITARVEDCR